MSLTAAPSPVDPFADKRIDVLFEELAELTGQRNAIDGRVVEIVAEIDRDGLWGSTGCRSVAALVAWKTGVSPGNAGTVAAVAHRSAEFPQCVAGLREGRLSLDQVGVIAERAADGSDAHYAELAAVATVSQLRTAIKLAPQPDASRPEPEREIRRSTSADGAYTTWRITLPKMEAAKFDAALAAHHDGQIAGWKRDRADTGADPVADADADADATRPFPNTTDAFMSLVQAGWDAEVAVRPHGQHTTVIVHVDAASQVAGLHLGPLLSDDERRYLSCDATAEVWFEREGRVIGAGRATRTVNRRLRRALEHRDRCCVVPGCGATRGLHAHHLAHWEDGGPTELWNLVLLCPFHHRLHHRGVVTISGTADNLTFIDEDGDPLTSASLARPPSGPPPAVRPYHGPTGERAQWWWYDPFQPQPPPGELG